MTSHRPPATTSPEAPAPALTTPKPEPPPESSAAAPNPSSPGAPPSPAMEATAEALTREEVLRRRRRRLARLFGVYRRIYWAMAEEVRARHRQYVWELGRSPLEAEQPPSAPGAADAAKPAVPRRKKCGFTGCKVRAMAMAKFCHSHILCDRTQALYKGCGHIIKSGAEIGQITCNRPILKASVPSLCNVHLVRSQRYISQAYKKVGFNPPATGQIIPDFSVLVAESVRHIQARRRQSRSAAEGKKCPKDGKVD